MRTRRIPAALEAVAVLLSAGALAWGWANHRGRRAAEQRLDALRSSHYRLADETRREVEALERQIRELKLELRRQAGTLRFEPAMTVAEAYELHPEAQAVFASFHLGGCSSCAIDPDETIESAARRHGLDAGALLAALNGLLDDEQREAILHQIRRGPNVTIQL